MAVPRPTTATGGRKKPRREREVAPAARQTSGREPARGTPLFDLAVICLLAAIAAVPWFNSWFLVWPLALAPLIASPRPRRVTLAFTLTALVAGVILSHRGLWPGQGWSF